MNWSEFARKGVEQGLRELRVAPEQRSARRLAAQRRETLPSDPRSPKVVILTPRSWASHVQQEAVIAHALALAGARVTTLTCGGGLEVCDRSNTHESPPMPCRTCVGYTDPAVRAHGIDSRPLFGRRPVQDTWPELDGLSVDELLLVVDQDLPLGELIDIPVQWFLLSTRADEPLLGVTRRRFLRSARAIAAALKEHLDELEPDHLLMLNGGFLFESIAHAVAEQRGIDVVSYERGFRHGTLFFSRDRPAIDYDITETWERVKNATLEPHEESRLDELLDDRRAGQTHFIPLSPSGAPVVEPADDGTTFLLFTNLTWDSAVIHREIAFPDVRAWISAAIEAIGRRPQDRLIIRIHPAELKLPGKQTREPFAPLIQELHPSLPPNVTVLGPEDPSSSYALMDLADVGLVYTSTTGLEMALSGKPVVVAAKTHYRGRGFTVDVSDEADFDRVVGGLGEAPSACPPDVETARRYANAFFFKRLIPAWFVDEPLPGLARLTLDSLESIAPGRDRAVDVIVDGVLRGGTFEYE